MTSTLLALLGALLAWLRLLWDRTRDRHRGDARDRRAPIGLTLAFGAMLGIDGLVVVRPALLRARQVRICADLRSASAWLAAYRAASGALPPRLDLAVPPDDRTYFSEDAWGHPFVYETDGQRFVLASLGSDGKEDVPGSLVVPYERPLLGEVGASGEVGGMWRADQVVTERGLHRAACK